MARFDYFVVFAEMRTGSNFLEANINAFDGLTCHGEAFNPNFAGYPNKDEVLGLSRETRDADPHHLLELVKSAEGLNGFRYFNSHDGRVLDAMLNEAVQCVMDGNKPEEVDKAMKLCCNFPMGPLELADLAGTDIVLHGMETLHKEFGDRLLPAPLLVSMVRSGDFGRKTGRGFYDYTQKG